MYAALVVKTSDENWEVVSRYRLLNENKISQFMAAHESEYPITGMITTSYEDSAVPGATWNGSSFSGGTKPEWMNDPDNDWSVISTYAILSNNVVLFLFSTVKNDPSDEKMQAAFNSEVSLVPIPDETYINIGTIWNGQEFLTGL